MGTPLNREAPSKRELGGGVVTDDPKPPAYGDMPVYWPEGNPRGLLDYRCHACGKEERGAYYRGGWQSLPFRWFASETEARGWWFACSPECAHVLNEREGCGPFRAYGER